jgi:transcriptional regulator with XRE-family HTH domain
MMSNKENFKALVSKEKTNTVERNRERIKNRAYLRESQGLALKVLDKLDELGWSQVRLANEMSVTPQQITKIVSGKENLTIEYIIILLIFLKLRGDLLQKVVYHGHYGLKN